MLLMKAWLETRWRLASALGAVALVLVIAASGGGLRSTENAGNLTGLLSMLSVIWAVNLAGAGIRTDSPFRRMRGLHGSMYFTLSLPVSRFRLLAVRAGFGFLETAAVNALMIGSVWSLFPLIRGNSSPFDLLLLILTTIVCSACFYFVSVSISTVLDEIWQFFGSILVIGIAWWIVTRLALTPAIDVFRYMGEASPLLTHRLPWPAMTVSLFVSAILFLVSLKIVQTREY